ncbi:hypothetical protein [Noviluteimonas gilva]|uniref:Uncharacterized protein n=1 Tax=Noviluteimonas gilva TaxID=2682097 RepID=A0A7C9I788_9GAMM|nr:hypothetical protein [Lysobacter gilvus]MUV15489.1 hypothetical protein [Lysobacter gilvus]
MAGRLPNVVGLLSFAFTGLPSIFLAFHIALRTFWPCPEGGCAIVGWSDRLHLIGSVAGVCTMIVAFMLLLQFPFVVLLRPFLDRATTEQLMFQLRIPGFDWYESLMRRWVGLLWRERA